jgi:N-methylhydantoinase A
LAASLAGLGRRLSLSSQVLPEIREFERASTTLINTYLGPAVGRYLADLQHRLPATALYIQQSNGGFLPANLAADMSVHTILSGPAGGVNADWNLGQVLAQTQLLTFDMGGTSTDVALIDNAIPFSSEYSIDGFPISIGVIDIHTVGAGGGSIA